MADLSSLVPTLMTMGRALLPVVAHGSSEAVTIGEGFLKIVDAVAKDAPDAEVGELRRKRDEVEAEVKRHADRTVRTLKGE